ncbi:hypothetical protein [Sphingomonas sp.]|uniref:hypothetical protein n=1 Tax=Sphingomonas sp. TaxID=28214 RepID=UPI0035C7F2E3
MNFVQWLNSLDELLYEVMSWLVFYPVTLWRILRRPLATMRHAEDQLRLEPERQYRDTVSPPIMLILTIVLLQGISLALDGANAIVTNRRGLAGLVDDNTTLLLLRIVLFGAFALILATRKVHRSALALDRDTLKAPFYAQCYAVAPLVLLFSGGLEASGHGTAAVRVLGAAAILVALVYYWVVETRWFRSELNQSVLRSLADAGLCLLGGLALLICIALLFR